MSPTLSIEITSMHHLASLSYCMVSTLFPAISQGPVLFSDRSSLVGHSAPEKAYLVQAFIKTKTKAALLYPTQAEPVARASLNFCRPFSPYLYKESNKPV